MTRLNQIVAAEKGIKARSTAVLTEAYKTIQKSDLFGGLSRRYTPLKDDPAEMKPPENKVLQQNVPAIVDGVRKSLIALFDTVATKERSNAGAKANIEINGNVILKDVPVTTLLFLEKQLVDLRTFISKLPTLDPNDKWSLDEGSGNYTSEPVKKASTRKTTKGVELSPSTDKHPAQVQAVTEDVTVGFWEEFKLSGALPTKRIAEWTERDEALQTAVKYAREEANSVQAVDDKIGDTVLGYIFH